MEKTIHKFLDHLLGDEVIAVMVKSLPVLKIFHIVSKKNRIPIFNFRYYVDEETFGMYREPMLVNLVSDFFDIENKDETTKFIKNWFGDKHDVNKVHDLKKFIPVQYYV
jgi:hypothetical protein